MTLVLATLMAFFPSPYPAIVDEEHFEPVMLVRPLKNLPYPLRPNRITHGFRNDRRKTAVRGKVAVRQ